MLKALDELEKAVGRLMEKTGGKTSDGPVAKVIEAPAQEDVPSLAAGRHEPVNDEAAELIRRAIKRLRSL